MYNAGKSDVSFNLAAWSATVLHEEALQIYPRLAALSSLTGWLKTQNQMLYLGYYVNTGFVGNDGVYLINKKPLIIATDFQWENNKHYYFET